MTDPYVEIAHHLPNDVAIGGALITMMEPHPGHELAYNRWYEDDHFYAGAMAGPWTFAGRRFVATRALRERRAAVAHSVVQPPDAGCYISLYWVTKGHEADNARWSYLTMAEVLAPHGRGYGDLNGMEFLARIGRSPEVLECHHVTGAWNYLMKVRLKTTRDLETFFSDVVKDVPGLQLTQTLIVLSSPKDTQFLQVPEPTP